MTSTYCDIDVSVALNGVSEGLASEIDPEWNIRVSVTSGYVWRFTVLI